MKDALEEEIRGHLADYALGVECFDVALRRIDNALAEHTPRGNELPGERLDWEGNQAAEEIG